MLLWQTHKCKKDRAVSLSVAERFNCCAQRRMRCLVHRPMRASLSLHFSLFKRQQAQISRAVEGHSAAFQAYERRYRKLTRTYHRVISRSEVRAQLGAADVVYVGDYHTLRQAQQSYLELVEEAISTGRPVVLAIEFVEGRFQAVLDGYLKGKLTDKAFLKGIGHAYSGGFDIWPGFKPLLDLARKQGLQVVAIDRRARGSRALALRDDYAARRIAAVAKSPLRPLVMVLMGQFHVAPCHLPSRVRATLGEGCERRHLVVYQNCEGIYWRLARQGEVDQAEAVELRPGELCLINTSPVVCQQTFLDYLEAESGDEQLAESGAAGRFQEMAGLIARFAGVEVGEALAGVEVGTVADLDFLTRAKLRGRFSRKELGAIRKQMLERESYYIPRARMAYLATLSVNHAAEEAAHFVRHCCVGEAMYAPRRPSDAFYARCLEEALGFFGSKLLNPRRHCVGVPEWAERFTAARGEERQIAAFVLAHKAAESEGAEEAGKLLPLKEERLFHAVSHGLGYMLGEALFRGFDQGKVSKVWIRELFHDPLSQPRALYFELLQQVAEL